MADEHDFEVVQVGQTGHDRLVVAEGAVTVQLEELLEDQLDIIAGLGALLVPETWTICQGSRCE